MSCKHLSPEQLAAFEGRWSRTAGASSLYWYEWRVDFGVVEISHREKESWEYTLYLMMGPRDEGQFRCFVPFVAKICCFWTLVKKGQLRLPFPKYVQFLFTIGFFSPFHFVTQVRRLLLLAYWLPDIWAAAAPGSLCSRPSLISTSSLRHKIIALVDFCDPRFTIRLISKNCENIIYFAITCFIIIYILSIS
jgi:hypothetical protein